MHTKRAAFVSRLDGDPAVVLRAPEDILDVYAAIHMPADSAVRNRSESVTVATPRGEIEVLRQEMRGLRRGSSWTWFWLAHRKGSTGWSEASTAREAIRRALLLPPRKLPPWVDHAAAQAEREITAAETENTTPPGTPPVP